MLIFSDLKKNLKKDKKGFTTIKLALLADTASQFIQQAIKGYGVELGIDFDIYEADYNQIERQVYDPTSELYHFNPAYVLIIRSAEHLIKDFYKQGNHTDYSNLVVDKIKDIYQHLSSRLKASVIINTYVEINDYVFGNFAAKTKNSFLYQVRRINIGIMELAQSNAGLFVLDIASLSAQKGYSTTFDSKMYINADMVFSIDFLPILAQNIAQIVRAISGSFKKCLILDLDNTTWGGIIGDDGMEGIQIGDLGMGKAFTELQLWALELKRRGVILAVCSKNTQEIAIEPFLSHPDMVLKADDIALFVANWENKVDNIRYIQKILNIGFDSMVFLDDNPFEREMVKSGIPELTVPDLPEDPSEYLLYLRTLNLFETATFTEEDEQRTSQYQQEAKRAVLQNSFTDEKGFLESLDMVSEIKNFDKFNIPRVSQLTLRSNQFNLRTIRYSEDATKSIAESPEYYTLSLSLSDKFGDHGLIAVVILKKQEDLSLFIDTWIMSCRVLKRGMENFTLNSIVEIAQSAGASKIIGEYIPTKKNALVKNHYQDLGFVQKNDNWELNVADFTNKENFINKKL